MGFFGSLCGPHRPEMEALGFKRSIEGISERWIWVKGDEPYEKKGGLLLRNKNAIVIYEDDADDYLRMKARGDSSSPEGRAASSEAWRRKMSR